jgi:hypothetical protein
VGTAVVVYGWGVSCAAVAQLVKSAIKRKRHPIKNNVKVLIFSSFLRYSSLALLATLYNDAQRLPQPLWGTTFRNPPKFSGRPIRRPLQRGVSLPVGPRALKFNCLFRSGLGSLPSDESPDFLQSRFGLQFQAVPGTRIQKNRPIAAWYDATVPQEELLAGSAYRYHLKVRLKGGCSIGNLLAIFPRNVETPLKRTQG